MLGLPQYHVLMLEEIEDATNNFDPSKLMEEETKGQVRIHIYTHIYTVCARAISDHISYLRNAMPFTALQRFAKK